MAPYHILIVIISSVIPENLVLLTKSEQSGPKSAHIRPTICHYYRFFPSLYYHTFYSKLCFSFSGMRSCLFVFASWPMFFIALLLWFITRAF